MLHKLFDYAPKYTARYNRNLYPILVTQGEVLHWFSPWNLHSIDQLTLNTFLVKSFHWDVLKKNLCKNMTWSSVVTMLQGGWKKFTGAWCQANQSSPSFLWQGAKCPGDCKSGVSLGGHKCPGHRIGRNCYPCHWTVHICPTTNISLWHHPHPKSLNCAPSFCCQPWPKQLEASSTSLRKEETAETLTPVAAGERWGVVAG